MNEFCRSYHVVGVTFDGRQSILSKFYDSYRVGKSYNVEFVNEDNNSFDENAVAVMLETEKGKMEKVGYLSGKNGDNKEFRQYKCKSGNLKSIGPTKTGSIGLVVNAILSDE